ncbi:MAG: hemolysin III family protein [Ectothiorhodospiraceae bacterium]|nr:hemolysin III family protein [Ectothiorhodospiraceae bacterium]
MQGAGIVSPGGRVYSGAEQWTDRVVHWCGIGAAVGGVLGLVISAGPLADPWLISSVVIYGAGLLLMLTCSALCNHDLAERSRYAELFKRLDHSAILFMIAATYTPFALNALRGPLGWSLFAFVWTVAAVSILLKLVLPGPLRYGISIGIYLTLGWCVLVVLRPLATALSTPVLLLLLGGGLLYSAGLLFFLWKRLPFHISIWHGFVIAAAACHYAAVLVGVVLSRGNAVS